MPHKTPFPRIIAHRGASHDAPENTMAALEKAAQLGATWVEFDVMRTQDGEAIVFHDDQLDRTTNGRGAVADTSYATIATLDAGAWFSPQYAGEKIPTFASYIQKAAALGLGINVEIKPTEGQAQKTAQAIVAILQKYWPSRAPAPLISSFSVEALITACALDASLQLGLLLDEWTAGWQDIVQQLSCISIHVAHSLLLDDKQVKNIKTYAPYLCAYTVDDRKRAADLFAMGVDAVFTNRPNLLKQDTK
jgi:glycerophosphoryl diester phosphodiesterase